MAITRVETQVTWSASDSVSVAMGGNQTSDEITLDPTCIAAQIHLKADNSTTPASDDIIRFWLIQTGGDPDGTGADEYDDTTEAPLYLGKLDTNANDPALRTVPLPIPQAHCKLHAEGATDGTTNAITVSATITEQRAA